MFPNLTAALLLTTFTASPALGMQEQTGVKENKATHASYGLKKVEFSLAVSGLTKENTSSVQGALNKLSIRSFGCLECAEFQDVAGECEVCGAMLVETSRPVFKDVKPSTDKGKIAFQIESDASVRLSQIEKILRESSIQVLREKSDFGKHATLVYANGASNDDASRLQTAFRSAKMADAVASLDPATKEILVQVKDSSLTWAKVDELGKQLTPPLRLTDVVWGSMRAPVKS